MTRKQKIFYGVVLFVQSLVLIPVLLHSINTRRLLDSKLEEISSQVMLLSASPEPTAQTLAVASPTDVPIIEATSAETVAPTETPIPSTETATFTSIPPAATVTDTPIPPTETATNTPIPPTETSTPEPTATPSQTPTQVSPQARAVTGDIEVRTGPGSQYSLMGFGEKGTIFTVLAMSPDGDWYNVFINSSENGWIPANEVELNVSSHLVGPAVTVPAPPPTATPAPTKAPTSPPVPTLAPTQAPPTLPPPTQPPQPLPAPAGCSVCSHNAYNCKHFSSQNQAQSCYQYCLEQVGRDVHDLDRDNDGIACESLGSIPNNWPVLMWPAP